MKDSTEFLKSSDLIRKFQISRGTLFNLMAAGKFPQAVKIGRSYRWRVSDIEAFERATA